MKCKEKVNSKLNDDKDENNVLKMMFQKQKFFEIIFYCVFTFQKNKSADEMIRKIIIVCEAVFKKKTTAYV